MGILFSHGNFHLAGFLSSAFVFLIICTICLKPDWWLYQYNVNYDICMTEKMGIAVVCIRHVIIPQHTQQKEKWQSSVILVTSEKSAEAVSLASCYIKDPLSLPVNLCIIYWVVLENIPLPTPPPPPPCKIFFVFILLTQAEWKLHDKNRLLDIFLGVAMAKDFRGPWNYGTTPVHYGKWQYSLVQFKHL